MNNTKQKGLHAEEQFKGLLDSIFNQQMKSNEKLQAIKREIENGQFKINSKAIAEKLVELESLIASKKTAKHFEPVDSSC